MSYKILVLGATGNVGSSIVEFLAQKGEQVKAATRHPADYPPTDNVEPVAFDFDRPETYAPALAGVDRVFALTKTADIQADKTLIPLIDQAKAAGVTHIVLMTAIGVDQAPEDVPIRRLELHLINSGIDYTILRPNWFMQNFSPGFLLPMIQQGGTFYLAAADSKTSFIDTRDIAAVAATALTEAGHAGQEYALTGSEAYSYSEAAVILSEAANREINYVAIDDGAFREALASAGWRPEQVGFFADLFYIVRQGWVAPVSPAVGEILGREPISLQQYAFDYAETWK
ncbi:MAG: SDR family oxidoreductase [Anaerolineales bacterium]|nr:SDR family oxidoreductase [Anaerolineales bacterium]